MTRLNITLHAPDVDVDDLYRRLSILHRTLDTTTHPFARLQLRAQIENLQRDLIAARRKRLALSYSHLVHQQPAGQLTTSQDADHAGN